MDKLTNSCDGKGRGVKGHIFGKYKLFKKNAAKCPPTNSSVNCWKCDMLMSKFQIPKMLTLEQIYFWNWYKFFTFVVLKLQNFIKLKEKKRLSNEISYKYWNCLMYMILYKDWTMLNKDFVKRQIVEVIK